MSGYALGAFICFGIVLILKILRLSNLEVENKTLKKERKEKGEIIKKISK